MNDLADKNGELLRAQAWDGVVHAEGTRAIFAKRSKNLKFCTRTRDGLGLAVPLIAVFLYSTEWVQKFTSYKTVALAVLTVVSLMQGFLVIMSLISSWDKEFSYGTRAQRDNSDLRDDFRTFARSALIDPLTFSRLQERQKLLNSHDEEEGITDWERQFGMRAGLIFCQRICVCGNVPSSREPMKNAKLPCVICGGN